MHLGFDEKILNILGTVARAFKASPVHLGKVISDNSVKEFDKLSKQLKKLETDKKRLLDSLEYEDEDTRRYESIEKRIETTDEKISISLRGPRQGQQVGSKRSWRGHGEDLERFWRRNDRDCLEKRLQCTIQTFNSTT